MLGASTVSCESSSNLDVELHDAKSTIYRTPNAYDAGGYHKVVIMGAGRLGQSLIPVSCNNGNGIKVVGMFDSDPGKIGLKFPNGVVVESDEYLPTRVIQHCVERGIIAVPAIEAQRAANALVDAGVRVILNYAPVNLSVPIHVMCERVDPAIQFSRIHQKPVLTGTHARSFLTGLVNPRDISTEVKAAQEQVVFNATWAKTMLFWQFPVLPKLKEKNTEYESFYSFLVCERKKQEDREQKTLMPNTYVQCMDNPALSVVVNGNQSSINLCPKEMKINPPSTERQEFDRWQVTDQPRQLFSDVAGLPEAKAALVETLALSESGQESFNSLLLYGPPGCGKTLLTKAIIGEFFDSHTFFNVPVSDLMNQTRGTLRELFKHAASVGPSVILIDNLQLMIKYKSSKAELVVALESLSHDLPNVVVVAATNLPWDLDISLLQHFEKRVYVPLPDVEARKALFASSERVQQVLEDVDFDAVLESLAMQTKRYSCSDVCLVMKDALMQPSRRKEGSSRATVDDFKKSCSQIRPTISREIIELYNSFGSKFGQLSYEQENSREGMEAKHYAIYS